MLKVDDLVMKLDVSLVDTYYSVMRDIFLQELIKENDLVRVFNFDGTIHKRVYLRDVSIDKWPLFSGRYCFYNPYSKKSSVVSLDEVIKIEVKKDMKDVIGREFLKRQLKITNLEKMNSISEVEEFLSDFITNDQKTRKEDLKKKGEGVKMAGYFKGAMSYKIYDYVIKNNLPVKFYYVDGSEEEGLYLKIYDKYQILAYDEDRKVSALIHKSNIIKMEVMGDMGEVV